MISEKVQLLFINMEHGLLSVFTPKALQRLGDKIIFGLDCAIFDKLSTVSRWINSQGISKTESPLLLSVITTLPPLLSSDIALSIFIDKFILFILRV